MDTDGLMLRLRILQEETAQVRADTHEMARESHLLIAQARHNIAETRRVCADPGAHGAVARCSCCGQRNTHTVGNGAP